MSTELAADDIVRTPAEASANEREPLLVTEPLEAWLDEQGRPELGEGPIEVEPIGDGHSNVTFAVCRGEAEFVLRRPPRGPLPPSAHDVGREARLLTALEPTDVRTPAVYATCADAEVIGAPFYVMEKVEGSVVSSDIPPDLDSPSERRRMAEELIDALVELHAVDWTSLGLEGFGKPTGYLERQLRRFTGLWEHNRTRDLPQVEEVHAWLEENLPESGPATIVHGDYRLGNVMLAPGAPARLTAIFDWEMATIGDPLADVGYVMMMWRERDDPGMGAFDLQAVTRAEGFPTRAELVARYEERSGRSMENARWYIALALWKAIVFMEGNYKRAVSGTTDDPFLKSFGQSVVDIADAALRMARTGEIR